MPASNYYRATTSFAAVRPEDGVKVIVAEGTVVAADDWRRAGRAEFFQTVEDAAGGGPAGSVETADRRPGAKRTNRQKPATPAVAPELEPAPDAGE